MIEEIAQFEATVVRGVAAVLWLVSFELLADELDKLFPGWEMSEATLASGAGFDSPR